MKKITSLLALSLLLSCLLCLASCRDANTQNDDQTTPDSQYEVITPEDTTTATPEDTTTVAPVDTTTVPVETTTEAPTTTAPQPVDPSTIQWTDANVTVYVKDENVWVRTAPDLTEGSKKVVLHFSDALECTATSENWCRVTYAGEVCYISSAYITTDNISENDFESITDTVYVTVASAWLRRGPSTDTAQLSSAVKGDKFTRVSKNAGWSKVTPDGTNYYFISNELISNTQPE